MRILLIRHGDPDYSIDSLTEKGWREAELLSRRLADLTVEDFYCSPLGRARDTAKPTLAHFGREAEILPWLSEFRGAVINPFGGADGRTERRIPWNLMPQYWSRQRDLFDKDAWRDHPLMSAGNVGEIYDETARGMDALLLRYGLLRDGYLFRCERNPACTIVLFAHFGVGMNILSHMLGVSLPVMWQWFFLPTSSVTTLVTEERIRGEVFFKCMQGGDTAHLPAGGEPGSRSGLVPELYERGQ